MKESLKKIFKLMKPYLAYEITGLILTVMYSVAVFASPIVSKYLIDVIIPANSMYKLYKGLGIFFLVCIMQPVIGYFKDRLFLNITERLTFSIRENLYLKVLYANISFFNNSKKGEIVSRIVNDGSSASAFMSDLFISYLKDIILVILIFCGMLYLSLKITCLIIFMVLAFVCLNYFLGLKLNKLSTEVQKNFDSLCTNINQMSDSIFTIKSFLLEGYTLNKFRNVLNKSYKDRVKIMSLEILLNNLTSTIVVFSLCIIYGIGTLSVMEGEMTLGTVIALGMYFQMLVQPVFKIVSSHMSFQKIKPIINRIYEYFEMDSESINSHETFRLNGDMRISNLCFSYDGNIDVLKNLSLEIKHNSIVGILGTSGSGKSTLIKILMGFYKPTGGEITIDEISLKEIGINNLRENIGYVSQDINLFNTSILENILCGKQNACEMDVIELCKQIGIHEKIMLLPEGYKSILSERTNLSGGEIQRIALARALIKKPSILILDEPTSALDPENEERFKEIIGLYSGQCTIIIITHNKSILTSVDNIYTLENGRFCYV